MVEVLKKWATVIRGNKKRLAIAIAGQSLYQVLNNGLDFIFLPALVLWYGIVLGGIVYMISTLVIDSLSIVLYNILKKDILGLELVKELRGYIGKKFLKSQKKISDVTFLTKMLIVLSLSLRLNPFQVVVFMRQANEYRKKMNSEDWFIFWTSYFGGNLYWIILMGGGIEFLQYLLPELLKYFT